MIRLLMTAAVKPQSNFRLNLTDPNERSVQYATALRKWCNWAKASDGAARIVFVENSGADLEALASSALGEMPEYLDLVSAPAPPQQVVALGKGASESKMLDYFATKYSHDPDEAIWLKATGRLYVKNLSSILPSVLSETSLLARLSLDLKHADARVFGASAKNWRSFYTGMGNEIDEARDVRLEHVLARRICLGLGHGAELTRFRGQPEIDGVSGTWSGRNYGSLQNSTKRRIVGGLDFVLREKLQNKHF